MSRVRRFPVLVAAALGLFSVGVSGSWAAALAAPGPQIAIIGAALVLVVASGLRMLRRTPAMIATVLIEVGAAVVVWPVVGPAGGRSFGDLTRGVFDGWHAILSATVPVPAVPSAAAFAYVLTTVAVVVAAEATFRTRSRVWPLAPGLAVVAITYVLGRGGPNGVFVQSVLVVVGAIVFGLLRARAAGLGERPVDEGAPVDDDAAIDPALSWNRRDAGLGIAVVAGAVIGMLLLVWLTPVLGRRGPSELHDTYRPRQDVAAAGNPLDEVGALSTRKDRGVDLFTVRLDRPFVECTPQRVDRCPRFPVAYLTSVDATGQWRAADDLRAASGSVSGDGSPRPPSVTVRQRIRVRSTYKRSALPGLERIVAVSGVGDRSSAADASTGQRSFTPGTPITYDVTSAVPAVPAETVAKARAVPGAASTGALDLGGFGTLERISRDAQGCREAGASVTPDAARLCALERAFAGGGFTVGPTAKNRAHALRELDAIFSADGAAATSEQFATAFADLAVRTGYRARVVVGYQLVTSAREFAINANDLAAWPEIEMQGIGWVPFSPFPGQQGAVPTTTTTSTTVVPSENSTTSTSTAGPGGSGEQQCADPSQCRAVRVGGDEQSSPVAAIVTVLLIGLVGALAGPPVVSARRRRRGRTSGDSATRVAAAWRDAMRSLQGAGIRGTDRLTHERAVTVVAERIDADVAAEVDALGALTDRALHSPSGVDEAGAVASWERADRVRTGVERTQPRAVRVAKRTVPWWRAGRRSVRGTPH